MIQYDWIILTARHFTVHWVLQGGMKKAIALPSLPWMPEGFFSVVCGEIQRPSRDRGGAIEKKKPSGCGSYKPHFHSTDFELGR